MINGIPPIPPPVNEPVLGYAPGSPERASLKAQLDSMSRTELEIPAVIGGKEVRTGKLASAVCPHEHRHVLATFHECGAREVGMAVDAARAAFTDWSEMDWQARAAIFLKAADLLAGPWRDVLNAATMLNQSKTAYQAEIDAACELIDFFRFNAYFMQQIYRDQPISARGIWDYADYRPLEGFVFAVTPFNFTSIGGNLPTAPALMGNVALWKPASTSVVSNYYIMRLLEAAGLPPGVINFIPGAGRQVGDPVLENEHLAGIHFTGSTPVFHGMWKKVGDNIGKYHGYPRLVGETGGKDFVFAHPSADPVALTVALVRGAFEYQGQKCSAASRAYVPKSLWPAVREGLVEELGNLKQGSPLDFRNFTAAVIDQPSFDKLAAAIEEGRATGEIVAGGTYDKSEGYFISPTVVRVDDPRHRLMTEELFGPVLTLFVYEDARLDEAVTLCDTATAYALTGAIFAQDRRSIVTLTRALRHAAGNFYINDKPTGAVVGQQPFGGGRASGTNDKAGSAANLMRWVSVRSIKENFVPANSVAYPFMAAE